MTLRLGISGLALALTCAACGHQPAYYQTMAVSTGEYRLSSGDQIRVMIFEQTALSTTYNIDAAGNVSIPLVGVIKAENKTARQVEAAIAARLKSQDLVTDPKVAVEIAQYRPFSILGEVKTPGRFPFAPGMTIEAAVALAGGYTMHADRDVVQVSRHVGGETVVEPVSPSSVFMPGDTITVHERWY